MELNEKTNKLMETDTHFKNRIRLKNCLSRGKLIKSLLTAFVCLFANYSHGQTWQIGSPNAADVTATYSNGTLTISGKGEMQNWGTHEDTPWYSIKEDIKSVIINNGVTTIGRWAFGYYNNLSSVTIPNTVTDIENSAFEQGAFTTINIPESVIHIGNSAFAGCLNLAEIHCQNPTPPSVDNDNVFWGINKTTCKLYVPQGTQSSYATALGWWFFDIVGCDDDCHNLFIQESKHIRIEIYQPLLSITSEQLAVWLSNLDRMYEQYVDLMSGLTPFEGHKIVIQSVIGIPVWAYSGNPIQWNSDYISDQLTAFVTEGDWSFGILHEMGHDFGSHIGGFGNGNTSYDWNEEMFANFRMYLTLTKIPDVIMNMDGIRRGTEFWDINVKEDYNTNGPGNNKATDSGLDWTLLRLGNYYQHDGDHGYWLYKQAFETINSLPRNEDEDSWSDWHKFNYFLDILSNCVGRDVRETYSDKELNLIELALGNTNYDDTLPDPTTLWQTHSDSIQVGKYKQYRISVKSGLNYTFKTGCGDRASADLETKISLYNSEGDRLISENSACESGGTIIENYQFNYDGYAFVRVENSGAIDESSTYGYFTLAYRGALELSWQIGYPTITDIIAIFNDGTLAISGTGAMQDWDWWENRQPWNGIKDSITNVIINNSITTIGSCAFIQCSNIASVNIGKDINIINDGAFSQCFATKEIHCANSSPPNVKNSDDFFWGLDKSTCKLYVPAGSEDAYKLVKGWKDFFDVFAEDETKTDIEIFESGKISIYPNPVKDEILIKSKLYIKKVEIYSLSGSLLIIENHFNEKISMSTLPKGIYLLKIYTEKGSVVNRIVKE